jgi:vitellogenic carboxypeptidase-like protein
MYYWYFPAQEPTIDSPLIIWLQGGPGSSSFIGLFYEMGPIKLTRDVQLVRNPYTWNQKAHMLFIDQPVGTGFSFVESINKTVVMETPESPTMTKEQLFRLFKPIHGECITSERQESPKFENGYVANEAAVAHDLVLFMDRFYRIFPELLTSSLYIIGESYAGKYIPAFAYQIHKVNQLRKESKSILKPQIPLKGVGIGNGFTDPITQIKTHSNQALALGLIGIEHAKEMDELAQLTVNLICQRNWKAALEARLMLFDIFSKASGSVNYYDVRKLNEQYNRKEMYTFLKDLQVKESLNVGQSAVFGKDENIFPHLEQDIMQSAAWYIPTLIENNYTVLLYQGQFDFRDGILSSNDWIQNIRWKGKDDFNTANRTIWYEKNIVAGYIRAHQNLIRIELTNAGHLAPYDQPFHSKQMIEKYLLNT